MQGEGRRGVAIVTAMGVESLGLSRALQTGAWHRRSRRGWREGLLGTCPVVLATCGIGERAAGRFAGMLLEEYEPRLVVLTGASGGVAPYVRVGDLVVGESVCRVHGVEVTERFPTDPELLDLVAEAAAMARFRPIGPRLPRVVAANVGTVDHFIRHRQLAEQLARDHGILAMEMEAAAIAEACRGWSVPFLTVRAITDVIGGRWQWLPKVLNYARVQRNAEWLVYALVQRLSEES